LLRELLYEHVNERANFGAQVPPVGIEPRPVTRLLEAMLLGEVVRDPKAEERILQQLIELKEAFTARHQAPHRRRMRMS
jgi:hypothetical protein